MTAFEIEGTWLADHDEILALLVYAALALWCLGFATAGMALVLKDAGAAAATLVRTTFLLPLAGLVVTPLAVGIAWLTGYSSSAPVVLVEATVVLGGCALSILAARSLAVRRAVR